MRLQQPIIMPPNEQFSQNTDQPQGLPIGEALLFRVVAAVGVIGTLASRMTAEALLSPTFTLTTALILTYLFITAIVLRRLQYRDELTTVNRYFGHIDAFLLGGFIASVNFSLLPLAIFFVMIQYQALSNGGLQRWIADNMAFIAGVLALVIFKTPSWPIDFQQPVSGIVLVGFAAYFCVYGYFSFARDRSLRQRLQGMENEQIQLKLRNYNMSKYLSPSLREDIFSGKSVKLETQRKKLTVFFSDIKGFSEMAEEMDGDALTALLNNYLTEMSQIALQFGGTIDKFIGDAVMVFFGDPESGGPKRDALSCAVMAIAMKKRMKELQIRWQEQGITHPLEIRMGINTGYCTVGNFGTENRLDYTLLGTEVNLASRLESAADAGEILISHETYTLIKDIVMCRDKGEIAVKGFQDPVKVYSVVDLRKNLGKDQNYFDFSTEGFSVYLDLDKIRNYDRDKALIALQNAYQRLKNKTVL